MCNGCTKRSYRRYLVISLSIGPSEASRLPWVWTMPLGSPVVPEVKRICRGESSERPGTISRSSWVSWFACPGKGAGTEGCIGARRRGSSNPLVVGASCCTSTGSPATRRGLVSWMTRSAKASVPDASRGTTSTPRMTQPKKHAIQAALFSPHSTTRSPGAMPSCWSSAANQAAPCASCA